MAIIAVIEPELVADGYLGWYIAVSLTPKRVALYATEEEAVAAIEYAKEPAWLARVGHIFYSD